MASQAETQVYEALWKLRVPEERLEAYGYPRPDPDAPGRRAVPGGGGPLEESFAATYECERCKTKYSVGADGTALTRGTCRFHLENYDSRPHMRAYRCCLGTSRLAQGCIATTHVHKGWRLAENFKGFVTTKPKEGVDGGRRVIALDCEMVYTGYGLELGRITLLNYRGQLVMDSFVKPANPIVDYNTPTSGINPGDLDSASSLAAIQRDLLERFSSDTIMVGHGLDSDMRSMKLLHNNFVDTAHLYPHPRGLPYKMGLARLVEDFYNTYMRRATKQGHDSAEDARYALRLALRKADIYFL